MRRLSLPSPAKLNLYLKVKNKRPDGYHELVTLFERVNLCDEITFSLNDHGRISIQCDDPAVPTGPKNFAHQAARLLQHEFAIANGVDIRINKVIPVAAGLAGGSSNAATTLRALNRLWRLDLPAGVLIRLGRQLGSDVPFFLYDCPWALGTGRGDVVKPVLNGTILTQILVVPRLKVYSSQVFRAHKLQLTKKSDDVNILIRALRRKDISCLGQALTNDLETTILRCHPNLRRLHNTLKSMDTLGVVFSGSGPAIYGLVRSKQQAVTLANILKRRYKQVFVVETLC